MIPLACVIFAHRIQDLDLLMLKQFVLVLVVKTHFGRFLALFLAVSSVGSRCSLTIDQDGLIQQWTFAAFPSRKYFLVVSFQLSNQIVRLEPLRTLPLHFGKLAAAQSHCSDHRTLHGQSYVKYSNLQVTAFASLIKHTE